MDRLLRLLGLLACFVVYVCCKECHPVTGECFEEAPETDIPHIWLACGRDNHADCEQLYGFEYDISHPHGPADSDWCETGTKMRCLSPKPPPLKDTPVNHLKVVAYNVFELDFFITFTGQRERTCRIPRWFVDNLPDIDVIAFQEVFMGGCWHNQATLREVLEQHGFEYHTDTVYSPKRVQPGGMFISSKWPILEENMYVFKNFVARSWDALAAKGVSHAKIKKSVKGESMVYHVMSTHLQAGGRATRIQQTAEWGEWMKTLALSKDEPLILAGDFNIDLYTGSADLERAMENIGAMLPLTITKPYAYTSAPDNDLRLIYREDPGGSWIDFVFYSREHRQPKEASQQVLVPAAAKPFDVCWCDECVPLRGYRYPDDPKCADRVSIQDLSDHQPVLGTFIF